MCTVTISGPIRGHEPQSGGPINRIAVSGTATTDCSAVSVTVHQTQPVDVILPTGQAQVGANGDWSVNFSVANGDFQPGAFVCGNGNKYVIDAVCVDDSQCSDHFTSSIVTCGACPVVTAQFRNARASDACNAADQRLVEITMTVVLGTSASATVTMEIQVAGSNAVDIGPTSTVTVSGTTIPATGPFVVPLSPGSYIVRARFDDPNCPPQEFTLDLPRCPELVCPEVTWSADIGDCDRNGRHPVTVTASVVFPGRTIAASMLDGQGNEIASGTQDDDLTLVSPALSLGGGDHHFSIVFDDDVTTVSDECRPQLENTFSLQDCGGGATCPNVNWGPDVAAECNDDGTRDVTVSATITSFGPPVTASLNDPQGNQLDSGTTPANGSVTLDSGALTLTPGNHTFRVAFTGGLPGGCAGEDSNVITVPACGRGNGGGNESIWCAIVRIVALIALTIAIFTIIVAACTQSWVILGIAIAAAVVAAAVLIAWALWCAPTAGCAALQCVIGFINLLIAITGAIAIISAAIAAVIALLFPEGGAPALPCLIGTAISALSDAGFLGLLEVILYQIFLFLGCRWEGESAFCIPH
jgi:hypothetical protein